MFQFEVPVEQPALNLFEYAPESIEALLPVEDEFAWLDARVECEACGIKLFDMTGHDCADLF